MFQITFVLPNPSELTVGNTEAAPTSAVPRCFPRGSPCVVVQLQTPSCSGKCRINQHQLPWGGMERAKGSQFWDH